METIPKAAGEEHLSEAVGSLDASRSEWAKLRDAVRQCVKDIKAEESNQRNLKKRLTKKEQHKKEMDVKAAAAAEDSQKKARGQMRCEPLPGALNLLATASLDLKDARCLSDVVPLP